jgi:hypothetical protein
MAIEIVDLPMNSMVDLSHESQLVELQIPVLSKGVISIAGWSMETPTITYLSDFPGSLISADPLGVEWNRSYPWHCCQD